MSTIEVVNNKDLFYSFPETQDDKRWEIIKEKMKRFAPHEDVTGMVFFLMYIIPDSKQMSDNIGKLQGKLSQKLKDPKTSQQFNKIFDMIDGLQK